MECRMLWIQVHALTTEFELWTHLTFISSLASEDTEAAHLMRECVEASATSNTH